MDLIVSGESHGPAIQGTLVGLPSGARISKDTIQSELVRRRLGFGRGERQKLEQDQVEFISGLRFGETLGSPLTFLVRNSEPVKMDMDPWQGPPPGYVEERIPRPGHADLTGAVKYGHRDLRNVWEMASARKTVVDVVAGSICKQILESFEIKISSFVERVGDISLAPDFDYNLIDFKGLDQSPLRMPDPKIEAQAMEIVKRAQADGDTLGGAVCVLATGLPMGLGSCIDSQLRLDARLAGALMSIPSVKAIEFGEGIQQSRGMGSAVHDEFVLRDSGSMERKTNLAGGIEGGISNGENLKVRLFLKPLSSLRKKTKSIHLDSKEISDNWKVRGDTLVLSSAGVISEAKVGYVLLQAVMERFGADTFWGMYQRWRSGQNGTETQAATRSYGVLGGWQNDNREGTR